MPDTYRDAVLERCRIRAEVEKFGRNAGALIDAGRGGLVFGPVGTGKSSTAALLAAEAIKAGKTVRWAYVPDLCDRMYDQWRRQEVRREQTLPDLLIWDDLGVRALSNFEIGMLDQIVEARYQRRKSMVVTTNLTPQQLGQQEFARMRDRWKERCDAWVIGGESMRGRA